jgi:hypothetical protein
VSTAAITPPQLVPGRTYTWDELAPTFDFEPDWLGVAGGMLSRPRLDALLLVTWPGRARSFDYEDYWSRGDLIYTGRGKTGDQKLDGANRDLADDRRTNYVFEGGVGSRSLLFVGNATATRQWRARGQGDDGRDREIIRYRLRFLTGGASVSRTAKTVGRPSSGTGRTRRTSATGQQHRQRRPFDPTRSPAQ